MYKILVADDEGIVLQSLKLIIGKNFGQSCQVETAKTGRGVIEQAEIMRPDIALVDIQMPGINGIDAIEEIKKFSSATYFIIITAYDKFDYAKKAIDLGVIDFLTKPFTSEKIVQVLEKTMQLVDRDRHHREIDLKNKEKLETVVPIIENGLIYTILFQEDYREQQDDFRNLLEIEENYGFIMIIEFGEQIKANGVTNPVGASVRAQRFYKDIREIIKEFFRCYVGAIMANKVVAFVPCSQPEIEYNERIKIIERARDMIHKLNKRIDITFKAGIGTAQPIDQLLISYKEAVKAMQQIKGSVSHIKDILPQQPIKSEIYQEIEKQLFMDMKKKERSAFMEDVERLYDFLLEDSRGEESTFRAKLFKELILVEREVEAYAQVKGEEQDPQIILTCSHDKVSACFKEYMNGLYESAEGLKEEVYSDIITEAKQLINASFNKDISLDFISRKVNISPYYFSKIFKEETGENFIDYLTRMRIEQAREMLKKKEYSIKEVCLKVGYKDPNYFSRLFKKQVGMTPTEYREG